MKFEMTTLGDYARVQGGFAYKSTDFTSSGVPVIKIKNVSAGSLNFDDTSFVNEQIAQDTKEFIAKPGDILISMTGSGPNQPGSLVGRVARVSNDDPEAAINQRVGRLILKAENAIDIRLLFYILLWKKSQEYLVANSTGSANQANISGKTIESIPVPKISYSRSYKIANILSAFDDKIKLNRQINRTLEQMAQAIFKSWFVDFDPVKAKAQGGDPAALAQQLGLSREILDLFPSEFEDSELGPIAKGWKLSTIGEEVSIFGGGTPSTKNPAFWDDGKYHWATPKDLSNLQDKVLLDTERKITDAGVMQISSGQLPKGTVLLSSRAPIGYLAVAQMLISINQGFIAMVCDETLSNIYVLQWANSKLDEIRLRSSGTTFQEINKKSFRPIPIIVPSNEVINAYDEIAVPIYMRIAANAWESKILGELRDALLPKLISGGISVAEHEE